MTQEERKQVETETLAKARMLAEQAAKGHDDLAAIRPGGSDKIKADAIRRFADVFLR